MKKRIISYNL